MNAAAKAAIRAGNYIFATDNRGIAKDAISDQLRMLDEVGRMTYDTRHQYLAGRHLDRLPGSPFVLMSHVAGLEGIGLCLNRENQIDDVFQRQVVSMRTVPAAPTEVVTDLLFRNADERAKPPSTVSIRRPCGVVVSAQVSLSDLKPAPRLPISSSTLSRSRVDLASRSSMRSMIQTAGNSFAARSISPRAVTGRRTPATQSGLYQPTCRLDLNGKPECCVVV